MHFLQSCGKTFLLDSMRDAFNGSDQGKFVEFAKLLINAIPEEKLLTVASEAVYIRYPFARPTPSYLPRDPGPQIEDVAELAVEEFYGSPLQRS